MVVFVDPDPCRKQFALYYVFLHYERYVLKGVVNRQLELLEKEQNDLDTSVLG